MGAKKMTTSQTQDEIRDLRYQVRRLGDSIDGMQRTFYFTLCALVAVMSISFAMSLGAKYSADPAYQAGTTALLASVAGAVSLVGCLVFVIGKRDG
jgi:hypothetical protein